jgi:type II secretory pathway component GspD/PulD (secretin)
MRSTESRAQLDTVPSAAGTASALGGGATNGATEILTLRSFVPGQSQGAVDAIASFTQALQIVAPDVRVVPLPTPGQIALVGPPASVRTAREFIDKADVVPPLVVLDMAILEVDESVAKNLGLQLGTAAISTTFTEAQPPPNADGTPGRLGRFQALGRTPISFTAQLNLLVQNGKGRVLGDLPLVGRVFRNDNLQGQRNELVIVVTPHIVKPGKPVLPGPPLRALPTPAALPTLPPNTRLPAPGGQMPSTTPARRTSR